MWLRMVTGLHQMYRNNNTNNIDQFNGYNVNMAPECDISIVYTIFVLY